MTAKKTKKTKSAVKPIPRATSNPFRPTGLYSVILDCLSYYKRRGISRDRLIELIQEQIKQRRLKKRTIQQIKWGVAVVVSARKGKLSHPSIRKASDVYAVIVTGDNYKLVLKG